jgi:hypothetical protein
MPPELHPASMAGRRRASCGLVGSAAARVMEVAARCDLLEAKRWCFRRLGRRNVAFTLPRKGANRNPGLPPPTEGSGLQNRRDSPFLREPPQPLLFFGFRL